jgi:hypothetical protein|tara:strand:- start:54 stop:974 length:921 start_codon:yes stop_codon:yes gene_type:complete
MDFADVVVGMEVLSLRTEYEVQVEFAKHPSIAYVDSTKPYIGLRGKVINKDMRKIVQVQFKDQNIVWFPCSAIRASVLKKGRFTPYHNHEVAESDLSQDEVGKWICKHCSLQSRDQGHGTWSLGTPWVCIGICETTYMLCRPCVFNVGGSGLADLWMASKLGNHSMVQDLLDQGHDPNSKKELTTWTPVHTAAKYGTERCIRILLEAGGDPNFRDIDGRSPLHLAAKGGHVDCVKYLLAHGAKTNILNKCGKSPEMLANSIGNHIIVHLINEQEGTFTAVTDDLLSNLGEDDVDDIDDVDAAGSMI